MIKNIGLFALLMILSSFSFPALAENQSSGSSVTSDANAEMSFTQEEEAVIITCVDGSEPVDGECKKEEADE